MSAVVEIDCKYVIYLHNADSPRDTLALKKYRYHIFFLSVFFPLNLNSAYIIKLNDEDGNCGVRNVWKNEWRVYSIWRLLCRYFIWQCAWISIEIINAQRDSDKEIKMMKFKKPVLKFDWKSRLLQMCKCVYCPLSVCVYVHVLETKRMFNRCVGGHFEKKNERFRIDRVWAIVPLSEVNFVWFWNWMVKFDWHRISPNDCMENAI